jgi:hypothetical protein
MRFVELAVGSEFVFEGITYRKTSPILAVDHTGHSRLIPRSAKLSPLHAAPPSPAPEALSELEQFYRMTLTIVGQQVHDVALMTDLRQALEAAYHRIRRQQDV